MQIQKSRDIWSNRQVWLWSTKRSRANANRVWPKECTGQVIAITLFQQHKRQLYACPSPDGQICYIHSSQRLRSSIQSAKTRRGADCGLDHELLISKFRLKLKEVGKSTRPFRYDLNQNLFNCTLDSRD